VTRRGHWSLWSNAGCQGVGRALGASVVGGREVRESGEMLVLENMGRSDPGADMASGVPDNPAD